MKKWLTTLLLPLILLFASVSFADITIDGYNRTKADLFELDEMPEPAVADVGKARLYKDSDGSVYLSVDGGAYAALGVAGSLGTDVVSTVELDDGADSPVAGECLKVATGGLEIEYAACGGSGHTDGANCSAGSYPLGVDEDGVVQSCTDASTEIDSIVATHTADADAHHTATVDTNLTEEEVEDFVGGMLGGTETLITVTYQDGTNDIDFVVDNDLANYSNASSGFITATLTEEQVEDFVGGMLGGTETGIAVTYQDGTNDIDFVVDHDAANNFASNEHFTEASINHDNITGVSADDHHNESHTIASHSDTTGTGAELNELTDGSETTLHSHAGGGAMSNFIAEDGDGTEISVSNAEEWKFVEGAGIDIDWTDTTPGSDADPFDLTFTVDHDAASNFAANEHFTEASINHDNITGVSSDDHHTIYSPTDIDSDYGAETITSAWNFGGATTFEIPNSATPSVTVAGQFALDSAVTDHNGMLTYHDGVKQMAVISIPASALISTDDYIIKYDAAGNNFGMEADAGGAETNDLETTDPPNVEANEFYIGSGSGAGAWVTLSGDVTNVAGAVTIATVDGITDTNLVDKSATEAITGSWDFGGASDFEIPNSATVTDPSVAGEMAIDTTTGQLLTHDGTAQRVFTYEQQFCKTVENPVAADDDVPLFFPRRAITVTDVYCEIDGGTNLPITISDGTNAFEAITCDDDGAEDDGSITNASFTALERMEYDSGTPSGTNTFLTICVTYTVDAD